MLLLVGDDGDGYERLRWAMMIYDDYECNYCYNDNDEYYDYDNYE